MHLIRRYSYVIFLIFALSFKVAEGQQVPLNPVSYRIFNPFIFNPAITGSKDFSSIDLIAGWQGKYNSQIISGNARLPKKGPDYFTSPDIKEFSNIGSGGYLFNENNSSVHNIGINIAGSYQIPLDRQNLSFLSFGASVKGVFNTVNQVSSVDPALSIPSKSTFYSNMDLGVYLYGPGLFAGASVTNVFGNPEGNDSLSLAALPVSRQYFFITGYKFLISRPLNIVLEPSIILNFEKTPFQKITNPLKPVLKVYIQDFCFGTYFNNSRKTSFFFQYKLQRLYIGSFFEIPKHSPYYEKELTIEFAMGINLSQTISGYHKYYHW